jgi:predicted O-methyltransferase YrrM
MNPYDAYCHWINTWSDMHAHVTYLKQQAMAHPLVLELGTRGGVSTSALLTGAMTQPDGHVWSIDTANCYDLFPDCKYWTFAQGDSLDHELLKKCGLPERLEMLFIDTMHTADRTYAEMSLYGPLINPGGIILLHDAYDPSSFPGVLDACMRYCSEQNLELSIRPGSYGMVTIEIPS